MCAGFEKAINGLHASEKYDIYITGSNAFLLSSDLATLFTGRTFEIKVYPFSFREYLQYFEYTDRYDALERYMREGGMAGSYLYKDPEAKYDYIADVFDTLIVRDIRQKYKIRNMQLMNQVVDFLMDNISKNLLEIDSTTGLFRQIQEYLAEEVSRLGYPMLRPHKGGLIANLGGQGNGLVVTAHVDDIGLMVRHVQADGTLKVCRVGGLYPFYSVTENVRVHTRDGRVYTGCVCRSPNSVHVSGDELKNNLGDFDKNVCVVLDEPVSTAAETRALGIETGDMIALEPRLHVSNGYVKSRFIDDKACAALLLAAMKAVRDGGLKLNRQVWAYFSVYEEIGHGTSWLPEGVKDVVALDIAPTGPEQNSDERKVSIFAKDSRYPYHWELTNELREAAARAGADYVMDIFTPSYGSDGDTSIVAGWDIRHAAFGPGTANSHGYERTHMDALRNTYALLMTYMLT